MSNISLLSSTSRVSTPYIKVTIGDCTFGVYSKTQASQKYSDGFYKIANITYPNYIQSLNIIKVNGQVNTYTLNIIYPVRFGDDPNFFEKVFSSVSTTRRIVFSYGDMSLPTFIYKEEEALITKITTNFDVTNSSITYTVSAVSSATLLSQGNYTFINSVSKKPSSEIKNLLYNKTYGLQEIFYGMNDKQLVESKGLIASDDKVVELETKTNISALDYLTYLVSCMIPASSNLTTIQQSSFYVLSIIDDVTGTFGGPYFKITKTTKDIDTSDAYEIDIGFPEATIVTGFSIDNNENYSIYYNWSNKLNTTEYVSRLDKDGNWTTEYSPNISSGNDQYKTKTADKTWWTKVTEYPISIQITLRGLLRPAILMSYVRLKTHFWGQKHISSGLYIVTKQTDTIDASGSKTVLKLTRIKGDE